VVVVATTTHSTCSTTAAYDDGAGAAAANAAGAVADNGVHWDQAQAQPAQAHRVAADGAPDPDAVDAVDDAPDVAGGAVDVDLDVDDAAPRGRVGTAGGDAALRGRGAVNAYDVAPHGRGALGVDASGGSAASATTVRGLPGCGRGRALTGDVADDVAGGVDGGRGYCGHYVHCVRCGGMTALRSRVSASAGGRVEMATGRVWSEGGSGG